MKNKLYGSLAIVGMLSLGGCASVAPNYPPSMENVGTLKSSGAPAVSVGAFEAGGADKDKVNNLTIRAGQFNSPVKNSFVEYIREALRLELEFAGLLKDNAETTITGIVTKNEIDASGASVGTADVEMRLTVRKNQAVRYDKTKSAHHEWESSFAGAVAIPKARLSYPVVIQKLLANFFNDEDFKQALK